MDVMYQTLKEISFFVTNFLTYTTSFWFMQLIVTYVSQKIVVEDKIFFNENEWKMIDIFIHATQLP